MVLNTPKIQKKERASVPFLVIADVSPAFLRCRFNKIGHFMPKIFLGEARITAP